MIIKINKDDEKEINKYLQTKEDNMSAVELINILLDEENNNLTTNDIKGNYFQSLIDNANIDIDKQYFEQMNQKYHFDNIKILDNSKYSNNPYIKNIKFNTSKNKQWILTNLFYNPYQGFVYDEIDVDQSYFKETVKIGYFTSPFYYPCAIEKDKIWMSVIPHEINTMKKPIENAFGNVLVVGLGLGYFAYMISNKEEVDSITIIEKDNKIISLFEKEILSQFKNKNKIKIINDDAFEYMKNMPSFDYAFIDIWHNVKDGLSLYLMSKYYENFYPNTRFEYWIETSLIAMLRRQMLTIFEEQYYENFKDKDYQIAQNNNDKIINRIYKYTKNHVINNVDDFRKLLEDDYLKQMAKELYL